MTPTTILTANMMCAMGTAPCPLVVLPATRTIVVTGPPAVMIDFVPMLNIMSFGMCTSGANPQVAAALGAPQPCTPMTVAPWAPPVPTVILAGIGPAVTMTGMATCAWGGVITQVMPGQMTTMMPI